MEWDHPTDPNWKIWKGSSKSLEARCRAISNYRKQSKDMNGFVYWKRQADIIAQKYQQDQIITIMVPK